LTHMNLKYIEPNELLLDSFKLGKKIYESGFIPTRAISLWRGGTPIGLGVGEYFRLKGRLINHTTVATASYSGINASGEVIIKGLEHLIEVVASEDNLLIIDDIYDSGSTVNAIIETIKKSARMNTPGNIVVGCIHYKKRKRNFEHNVVYIEEIDDNVWLSYPHEISDLVDPKDKDDKNIYNKSPEIHSIVTQNNIYETENISINSNYFYCSLESILIDSLKLASNIYHSGYRPDFLIALWPGGISSGISIHEFFKYKEKKGEAGFKAPDHISINTSLSDFSYKSNIIGIKYLEDNINFDDKILIVNTEFASGRLVNQTIDKLKEILKRNITLENIKVASIYYYPNEDATRATNPTFNSPHYFLKKTNATAIFPQQIHRLLNPERELETLFPQLKKIIYG